MYSDFAFNLAKEGTPEQHILFRPNGADPMQIPVPDVTFPADLEQRFRQMYRVLVDRGLIENLNPIFHSG